LFLFCCGTDSRLVFQLDNLCCRRTFLHPKSSLPTGPPLVTTERRPDFRITWRLFFSFHLRGRLFHNVCFLVADYFFSIRDGSLCPSPSIILFPNAPGKYSPVHFVFRVLAPPIHLPLLQLFFPFFFYSRNASPTFIPLRIPPFYLVRPGLSVPLLHN